MMAAARAAECGAEVVLLEKTRTLGNKLRISGRGRSNLTNLGEPEEFIAAYGPKGKFLINCLARFSNHDSIEFFAQHGVKTVADADGRVFPASGNANEVADCLVSHIKEQAVKVRADFRVSAVLAEKGRVVGVRKGDGTLFGDAVILATGGKSYPKTGSDGDGYALARELGHKIIRPRPALVGLVVRERYIDQMQGVTCPDAQLTFLVGGRPFVRGRGAVLFTHFGLSGPAVLDASREVVLGLEQGPVLVRINLLPDYVAAALAQTLQKMFAGRGAKSVGNLVDQLLPRRIVPVVLRRAKIRSEKKCGDIMSAERTVLARTVTGLEFTIARSRPIEEAMVTSGGVALEAIDPKTLESKIVKGLFFCGEVIDIDGLSGGYNLQAAFSTGYVAGEHAAK